MKTSLLAASLLACVVVAGCSKSNSTGTASGGGGAATGASAKSPAATAGAGKFSDDQVIETFGWYVGSRSNVTEFGLTKSELEALLKGFRAAGEGKQEPYDLSVVGPMFEEVLGKREIAHRTAVKAKNAADASTYFTKLKSNKGVIALPSGLCYEVVKTGTGPSPGPTDTVRVHYEGRFLDGTVFDSSIQRGEPAVFALNGVIRGWTEGLQKTSKGGKLKLHVPAELGYGEEGRPGIPPGATLVFDVELLDILPPGSAPLPLAP